MLKVRVIPTLLFNGISLVKGEGFDSWRTVGTLTPAVRVFNRRDVDELLILDVTARRSNRPCDPTVADEAAANSRVPVSLGGGVSSVEDVRRLLAAGADKIVLNTAAVDRPELIDDVASRFGSQCVVVAIDVRNASSGYECFSMSGSHATGMDPVAWAKEAQSRGAGELIVTRVERDGTMQGYDLPLISSVCAAVDVPVVASGGASSYDDLVGAVRQGGASAVAAGALFQFTEATPAGARDFMASTGIPVRVGVSESELAG